ncbi:MAG: mandelate racemase/muconate lactonizing enzyme family protein [Planctomycetota bacterium]
MKITGVKAAVIEGNFNWIIVRVDTDAGVSGYGEMRNHFARQTESYADPRELAWRLAPWLVGQNPMDGEALFRRIQRFGGRGKLGGGVSAVETALWDITGKALGVPVHRLLGGKVHEKVRIYCDCHAGRPIADCEKDYSLDAKNYTPEAYATNARAVEAMGFTLLKFDLFGDVLTGSKPVGSVVPGGFYSGHITERGLDYEAEIVRTVRGALRRETELAFDCAVFRTAEEAIRFAGRIEDLNLAWLEDLLVDTDAEHLAEVTSRVTTPTLIGENIYLAGGFRDLIERRAIRIPAPDLTTVGGIRQMKLVAELAEMHGMKIAPHFAGSPIGMLASVQAACTMPNLIALEFHAVGTPWWDELITGVAKPLIRDGAIEVPDAPGLGFEIDEEAMAGRLRKGTRLFE